MTHLPRPASGYSFHRPKSGALLLGLVLVLGLALVAIAAGCASWSGETQPPPTYSDSTGYDSSSDNSDSTETPNFDYLGTWVMASDAGSSELRIWRNRAGNFRASIFVYDDEGAGAAEAFGLGWNTEEGLSFTDNSDGLGLVVTPSELDPTSITAVVSAPDGETFTADYWRE